MQRDLMDARRDVLFSFSNFAVTFRDGRQVRRYLRNWLTVQRSWDEAIGPGEPFSGITWLPAGRDNFLVHIGDMSRAELADNYVLTSSLVVRWREAGDSLRFAEDLPIDEDCTALPNVHPAQRPGAIPESDHEGTNFDPETDRSFEG
jgi:hypothetical protein